MNSIAPSGVYKWEPAIPEMVFQTLFRRWQQWGADYLAMGIRYGMDIAELGANQVTWEQIAHDWSIEFPDHPVPGPFETLRLEYRQDLPAFPSNNRPGITSFVEERLTADGLNAALQAAAIWMMWRITLTDVLHRATVFHSRYTT